MKRATWLLFREPLMAVLKGVTRRPRSESLRGRFMVDTVRGVIRIRKWPKKRGTPTSEKQLYWIDWFRQANYLAKYVDAATARLAIALTKGSGKYPRDIILQAMRGRLYSWQDQNGKKWYPMAAVQDISESLDVLAQTVGSVLVRATDRWRAPPPTNIGDVLTYQGPAASPLWAPAAGGGGFSGGALIGKTAGQLIPNATWTTLTWDDETYDTANLHDNVTNNSRITVPAGTNYISLNVALKWTSSSTGYRSFQFRKNGSSTFPGGSAVRYNAIGNSQNSLQSPVMQVAEDDYFEIYCYHNAGSNKYVEASTQSSFSMALL